MLLYNQTAALDDPNQLEITFSTTGREMRGAFTSPRGSFVMDSTRWVFFGPGQYILLEENHGPDSGNGMHMICRVTACENVDGSHTRVFYEVDYLRTYYRYYITNHTQSTAKVDAFANGAHMVGCSNSTDWNRWLNVELPVTGNYTTTTVTDTDAEIERVTSTNPKACYLVVMKCQNHSSSGYGSMESPGCSAVLLDTGNFWNMLRFMSAGDHDSGGNKYRPSVIWSMIQGVYFLPGVQIDTDAGTCTLSGVNKKKTPFLCEWYDGGQKYVDLVTCKVENAVTDGTNVIEIVYNSTGGIATWSFAHDLSITLDDFRDIYYKAYKMYLPYIGVVDVPVKLLATYPTAGNDVLLLGIDYVYNIYEGSVTYRWTALPGIENSAWHPLPQVPLSLTTSSYAIQMNNDRLALNAVTSAVAGIAGVASGNVGAGVGAAVNIGKAIAETDMANNAAAIGNVQNTSQSGFQGYAYNVAYLTTVEMEIGGTFSNYMQQHGYPMYTDPTLYNANYRIWLDVEYWIPDGSIYINIADVLKKQISEMKYVYIKGA